MREYPNFYENLKEAIARLNRTVVLYGDQPCYVLAITDHRNDGIFRMWLEPVGMPFGDAKKAFNTVLMNYQPDFPQLGVMLDEVLKKYPDCGVMRKHMNSPLFKRFRPFPLGMCHVGTQLYYVERQPVRPRMEQGLTNASLFQTRITAGSRRDNPRMVADKLEMRSPAFKDCILGDHFTPPTALEALRNPAVAHDALAFSRDFALVRGPIDMLFLAYRTDIIGALPNNSFDAVRLGKEFNYCREAVQELRLFSSVN